MKKRAINFKDETGNVYGNLTVLGISDDSGLHIRWDCICNCGRPHEVSGTQLRSGRCLRCPECRRVKIQHGGKNNAGVKTSPEYRSWESMLRRCQNECAHGYNHYGGRGIEVCDRWNPKVGGSFENFVEDMGERPDGMTLDRIDVNGNYCKENCRWSSQSEQMYNTRKSSRNTSGRTGVSFRKDICKWQAYINHDKKFIRLGTFSEFEDACRARQEAEILYWGYTKE